MNGYKQRAAAAELADIAGAQIGERVNVQPSVVEGANRTASGWRRVRARTAKSLHVWVIAATGADLVRTATWMRNSDPFR